MIFLYLKLRAEILAQHNQKEKQTRPKYIIVTMYSFLELKRLQRMYDILYIKSEL